MLGGRKMFLNENEEAIIGAFLSNADDYCFEDMELISSQAAKYEA